MKHQIRTEIIINASKEKVYDILTNLEEYEQWNPLIVKSEGEVKTGNTVRHTMKNGDKLIAMKPRIMKAEPGKAFEWLGSLWFKGLFDGFHYFHIEELEEGKVKMTQGEKFGGILVPLIMRMIGENTRNGFVALNKALKERAESDQ